jgi:hypothetical protein
MRPDSPNFKDGRIASITSTSDYVTIKISVSSVEGGELTMDISPNPEGWIHLHFSGLGDKVIEAKSTSANGVDVFVSKRK